MRPLALLLALAFVSATQDPAALIEQLQADDIEVREKAFTELEKMGAAAEEALKKASPGGDAHVARLLRILELRRTLPPALQSEFPNLASRLGRSSGVEWTRVYQAVAEGGIDESGKPKFAALSRSDLEPLAVGAVRGASSSEDKLEACRAAERWFHRSATSAILGLLRDPDPIVRNVACQALSALWGNRAASSLVFKELTGDPAHAVEAADYFRGWIDESLLPSFTRLVRHPDPKIRDHALVVFDDRPTPEVLAEAVALLGEKDPETKIAGLRFISRQKHRAAGPAVIALLADSNEEVRSDALETLSILKLEVPAGDLIRLMEDPEDYLSIEAMGLACERALAGVKPVLLRRLESGSEEVCDAALNGLKTLKDPDLIEAAVRSIGKAPAALGILSEIAPERAVEQARIVVDSTTASTDAKCSALTLLKTLKAEPGVKKYKSIVRGADKPLAAVALERLVRVDLPAARELLPDLVSDPILQRYVDVGQLIEELAPEDPVPHLMKVLTLPEGNHYSVCQILATLHSRAAFPLLKSLLREAEPQVLREMVPILVSHNSPEAREELVLLLERDVPEFREEVLEALGRVGPGERWKGIAALATRDPSPSVRIRAVEVLGRHPVMEMIPVFESVLRDVKRERREHEIAASAWIDLGDKAVLKFLMDRHESGVSSMAADLLSVADPDSARRFIPSLLDSREPGYRKVGITLCERLDAKELAPALLSLLRESATGTKAADVLITLEARKVVPALEALLATEDFEVRTNALIALTGLQSQSSIPAIRELLKSKDIHVQNLAIQALGRIRDKGSVSDFVEFLKSPHETLRMGAIQSLGWIGDPMAAPDLRLLLKDEKGELRGLVAAALGRLKCREAIPELMKHLNPSDHQPVLSALGDIGDKSVAGELARKMELEALCTLCVTRALVKMQARETVPILSRIFKKEREAGRSGSGRWMAEVLADLGDASSLAGLLQDESSEDIRGAARELARRGHSQGVRFILQYSSDQGQDLAVLNRLRNAPAWKALTEARCSKTLYGTRKRRLERLAQAAGLSVRWEGLDTMERRIWSEAEIITDADRWEEVTHSSWESFFRKPYDNNDPWDWSYILEDDHIRVLPTKDALRFWKQWWADEQEKQKK